jgi:hypothetical protein
MWFFGNMHQSYLEFETNPRKNRKGVEKKKEYL